MPLIHLFLLPSRFGGTALIKRSRAWGIPASPPHPHLPPEEESQPLCPPGKGSGPLGSPTLSLIHPSFPSSNPARPLSPWLHCSTMAWQLSDSMTHSLPASPGLQCTPFSNTQAHGTFTVLTPSAPQPLSLQSWCLQKCFWQTGARSLGGRPGGCVGWGWGYVGGRSFIFAAGRGFSPATGSGPDSKWSIEPWGRRGVGSALGKMTPPFPLLLRGQAEEGSSDQAGLPPVHPVEPPLLCLPMDTPKGVGGAPQPVPETTPGPKRRGRREGRSREVLGQLLSPPPLPWLLAEGEGIATGEQLQDRAAS